MSFCGRGRRAPAGEIITSWSDDSVYKARRLSHPPNLIGVIGGRLYGQTVSHSVALMPFELRYMIFHLTVSNHM